MKNAMKTLLSLALVAVLLVSALPVQANAAGSANVKFVLPGENDDFSMTYLEGDPVYAGKIARNYVEFEKFIVDGKEYGIDESVEATDGMIIYINNTEGLDGSNEEINAETSEETNEVLAAGSEDVSNTVTLVVYEEKDNTRKEWGSKQVTLTKNSTTVAEMVAKSGYGEYESVEAKVNGKSVGRAEFVVADGDQIDLYIVPASKGTPDKDQKPADKDEDKKPADRDEDKKPADKDEDKKPADKDEKPGKGEKVTLRVWHNDGTSNFTDIRCYADDNLLDVIESNEDLAELTREGYKLIGWAFEMNNDDGDWIAAQHKVSDDDDLDVFADWQETIPGKNEKGDVVLRIYLNENGDRVAKVVNMEKYASDGKITLTEVEKVVRKYYEEKYTDDDMDIEGLFTKETFNRGDYDMDDAKSKMYVKDHGDTVIYVMVRDAQRISSGTADSSNPKTGDNILMVVSIMVMSGAALAYVFSKKRAVK